MLRVVIAPTRTSDYTGPCRSSTCSTVLSLLIQRDHGKAAPPTPRFVGMWVWPQGEGRDLLQDARTCLAE